MLRTTTSLFGILSPQQNSVCVQCVRWRRKPRWLPVAKSKMFRIPERPNIPEDEKNELKRLNNNYHTLVRSIRRHIRESVGGLKLQTDTKLQEITEEEDFARSSAINNDWNKSIAEIREIKLAKERAARREHILTKVLEKEAKEIEKVKIIDEKVRRVKEESVTFITTENIDRAIEDALANTVNHNWAIDDSGTIHREKFSKPSAEDNRRPKRAHLNI